MTFLGSQNFQTICELLQKNLHFAGQCSRLFLKRMRATIIIFIFLKTSEKTARPKRCLIDCIGFWSLQKATKLEFLLVTRKLAFFVDWGNAVYFWRWWEPPSWFSYFWKLQEKLPVLKRFSLSVKDFQVCKKQLYLKFSWLPEMLPFLWNEVLRFI